MCEHSSHVAALTIHSEVLSSNLITCFSRHRKESSSASVLHLPFYISLRSALSGGMFLM